MEASARSLHDPGRKQALDPTHANGLWQEKQTVKLCSCNGGVQCFAKSFFSIVPVLMNRFARRLCLVA